MATAETRRRAYEKQREKWLAQHRAWRAANPGYSAAHAVAYRERHPERYAAAKLVRSALRNGTLQRPDACSSCGVPCKPDAHHEDYSKPLDVTWLCRGCHRRGHDNGTTRVIARREVAA